MGREGEQKEEKRLTSQTKTPQSYFQSSMENIFTTSSKIWVLFGGFFHLLSIVKIILHELKRPHLPKRGQNSAPEN